MVNWLKPHHGTGNDGTDHQVRFGETQPNEIKIGLDMFWGSRICQESLWQWLSIKSVETIETITLMAQVVIWFLQMVVCGYPLVNKPGDAPVFVNAKPSRKQAFARPPGYTTNHGFPVFSSGFATYQATTGKTLIVSCFKRHTTPLCIRSLVLATAQVKMFPKCHSAGVPW
jgi:hypothetical protein